MEALYLGFAFLVGVLVGYLLVPVLDPILFKKDGETFK